MRDPEVGVENGGEVAQEEIVQKNGVVRLDEEGMVGREGLGRGLAVGALSLDGRRAAATVLKAQRVELNRDGFHLGMIDWSA